VGEETGAIDDMMQEVAELYQRDVEYELKTLSSQIEPILIVALGVLVLVVALAVYMPMWDLGKTMLNR
jgi:MSHA biogenesis protein MshG